MSIELRPFQSPYKSVNLFFLFLLALLFVRTASAQISFTNVVPTDISVCQSNESFTIAFTNQTGSTLSNMLVNVQFPTGIEYVSGSISSVSGGTVTESNISVLSNVSFNAGSLANESTLSFQIEGTAGFDAYTEVLTGTVFRNTITVSHPGGSEDNQTDAYNVLYPALSITSVDAMSQSAFVGETFTRTVTIVNGGFGAASSVLLSDIHDSNITWDSADKGTLNGAGSELTLSSADFTGIGDGDTFFERNESITITQTITAAGCNSVQSTMEAFWGCDSQTGSSNIKYPYTEISLNTPSVSVTPTASFNTCMDGTADVQQLRLKNNGSGTANVVEVNIIQDPSSVYSRLDANSIEYNVNGGSFISIAPNSTTAASDYDCLGSSPVGAFEVTIPNLQPGDEIYVRWDSYSCTSNLCTDIDLIGWKYEVYYTDMCNSKSYSRKKTGQETKGKSSSVFFESPSDLTDGQTGEYVFILSSASIDMPEGTNPYFEAVFDIPDGLTWSGNASDLTYKSGQDEWTASSITYSSGAKTLTAVYDLPIPFELVRSEFHLNLTLDCSVPNVNGSANVGMQLFYIMDSSCSTPFSFPLTCHQEATTYLHCPGSCTEGLAFKSFDIERTTFGDPDNDQDGLADGSGSLNTALIKTNRVMVSDEFKTTFIGKIKTSVSNPDWSYGYAASYVPYGDYITMQDAEINVTDNSSGQVLSCSTVSFSQSVSNGIRTVDLDFSPSTLVTNGCSNFTGYVFDEDDDIELIANYKVTGNIGGAVEQVQITNDFYVSPTANGTAFQCDTWAGNFTLIGYYFEQSSSENYVIKSCTKVIEQDFFMSIGDCCTNFAGGDFFPYEYRNWGWVNNVRVTIPDDYALIASSVDYYRTKFTNKTVKEETDITAYDVNGQTYQFDLASYFTNNGGTLNLGDDGFNGTISLEVQPTCTAQQNSFKDMNWYITFEENAVLGGGETAEYTSSADRLKYRRGNPTVSSTLQTVDGTGTTVSWDVKVSNSVAAAPNTWIFPFAPNGAMVIESVEDLSDNTLLTEANGFYQLGELSSSDTKSYRITASYNSCSASSLKVYSGYDCAGYPTNLNSFDCGYDEYPLYVNPQPSELQVRAENLYDANDPCDPYVTVQVELLSSKLAAVKDIEIEVEIPSSQSITMVSGSVKKSYPVSSAFEVAATPSLVGNTYTILVNDLDSIINADGLVGITDFSANSMYLQLDLYLEENFIPGDFVTMNFNSKRACNDALPELSLAFDPNAVFGKTENIGLESSGDNWGGSWGDYDNDGYPDLFVVSNDLTEPNELYHNNGDGTFSILNVSPFSTDLAPSISSSWADYDNDGDLDLYVGNNIGYTNFLYRNEGSGNFTKIQNDPTVSDIGYSHGVSWADYNNDGYVDLFVATFWETAFNQLYHNNGDGTFTKVGNNAVVNEAAKSISGVWGDYDNDGWIDLYVVNVHDTAGSLYKNTGNGNFTKITTGAIATDIGSSVGASWGDYNNDGFLDLFVANAGGEVNFLYKNNGNGTFTKVTSGVIVNDQGHSHGSAWADFDNDGDLDLFVANDEEGNKLYRNDGNDVFTNIDNAITEGEDLSFGAAWADYNLDGDLDLFVANREGTGSFLFDNVKGRCLNWTCIQLVGTLSNTSAIGAKVFVHASIDGQPVMQMREITSQSGGGTGGQNEMKLTVGLAGASTVDSIVVQWPSGFSETLTNQAINQCITITETNASEICGTVYYDADGSCTQNNNEIGVAGEKIVLTPGNITAYTDANGNYSVYVEPGIYGIQHEAGSNWTTTCPNAEGTRSVNVTGIGGQYCGNDFGANASCALPDLYSEVAITAHRIGEENLMVLNYENKGASSSSNTFLKLGIPSVITIEESSTAYTSLVGDTVSWDLRQLAPGNKGAIYIKYTISNSATIGQMLSLTTRLTGSEQDCNASDDAFTETSMAVASFDPNDILVQPEGFVKKEEWLEYKIRFQNVGNFMASQVRVEDVLPAQLDITSFEMGTTSHLYQFETDGRKLTWTFPNINLPDSLSNEPGSHGFITFRIKPKADLMEGDKIENLAAIYFDNLDPIITNTVVNIINSGRYAQTASHALPLLITPNPTAGDVSIQSLEMNLEPNTYFIEVQLFDFFFKPMLTQVGLEQKRLGLNLNELPSGSYMVRAIDNLNRLHIGKVVVVKK